MAPFPSFWHLFILQFGQKLSPDGNLQFSHLNETPSRVQSCPSPATEEEAQGSLSTGKSLGAFPVALGYMAPAILFFDAKITHQITSDFFFQILGVFNKRR